jgi:uncharacterized protein (TIGR03437 family)
VRRLFLMASALAVLSRAQSPVPSTFFAVSAVQNDYPKVNMGTMAHNGFAWVTIERAKGKFDFQAFDNYIAGLRAHGLIDPSTNTANLAMTLAAGTPSWALADQSSCGGDASCTAPPDNIQDWKDFVTAVVAHYNGKTQPHIRYYELWNEFNVNLWWTGTDAQLVALAQAAYPIIHQDPNSILLTPSVAGPVETTQPNSSVTKMTSFLQAGGSKYADGGAFHGYLGAQGNVSPFPMPEQDASGCKAPAGCYGSIITKANQMRAVFDQNGLAGKAMYQTEGSWGNMNVTDSDTQVAWASRFELLQAGLRSTLNLQMAAWFTWGGGTTFGWGDIETAALDPNAAGYALDQVYNWVVGATIAQPCTGDSTGTWTCALTRPGGYQAVAVWSLNGIAQYKPAAGYPQFRDLSGAVTPVSTGASVAIGIKPILLEGVMPGGSTPVPVITLVANAEGEIPLVAPNTWLEIKGFNLAPTGDSRIWQDRDISNNQMPAQLDHVSVTINGKSAYVYYISPTQVNVLTPPDVLQGPVQIQLNNGGAASAPVTVNTASLAASLFVFNGGPYVAAQHADFSLLGPPGLYPGLTTPAKPGDTVLLYANGFGPTSTAVVSGSTTQSGTLSPLPSVSIGGLAAKVAFAGLVAPGQFQLNVVVPQSLADGDQPITVSYAGQTTQSGTLLTVRH